MERSTLHRILNVLALVVTSLALLVLLKHFFLPFERVEHLSRKRMTHDKGHCYRVPVGVGAFKTFLGTPKLSLFEDGIELTTSNAPHDLIRERGEGRYSHWNREVYFSSSDGTDPRKNKKRYEARYQIPLPWWVAVVVTLSWVFCARAFLYKLKRTLERGNPALASGVLFLVALAYRLWIAWANPDLTFHHIIHGVPFSDGRMWDTLAKEFSTGLRADADAWMPWAGRRPFYYWFVGSLFVFTGPHLAAAIALKIFLGCVSSVLIFDLFRRCAPFLVALACGLLHAFHYYDAIDSLIPRTEGIGAFFTTLGLWCAVVGYQKLKEAEKGSAVYLSLLAGIALGCSNLARPLTLLAIGLIPLATAALWYRSPRPFAFRDLRNFMLALVLGGSLVIVPWLVRQKVTHGIVALSDNSVEMLVAARDPAYGTWKGEITAQYQGPPDIAARYQFYAERASFLLKEHFWFYSKNVAFFLWRDVLAVKLSPFFLLFVAAAAFFEALRTRGIRSLRVVAVGTLFTLFPHGPWWWVVGTGVALAYRSALFLVGILIFSALGALALCASSEYRMLYSLEVFAAGISGWMLYVLLGAGASPEVLQSWNPQVSRWIRRIGYFGVLLFLGGAVVAQVRYALYDTGYKNALLVGDEHTRWVNESLMQPGCENYEEVRSALVAQRGIVRSDYLAHIKPGTSIAHWSKAFKAREYPISVFETLPTLRGGYGVVPDSAGAISEGSEYVFVGTIRSTSQFENLFEIVSVFELNKEGGRTRHFGCEYPERVIGAKP